MHWVIKYCSHIFACVFHNNPNVFTTVKYIKIYSYNITRVYQSYILPYLTSVSLPIKCAYRNIQLYPPCVYHVIRFYHYWENMCTVTYRPVNPVCTIYYACLSNGPFSVVIDKQYDYVSLSFMWFFGVRILLIRIFLNSRVICDRMLQIDVLQYWFMLNALRFTDTLNPENIGFINNIFGDTYDYIFCLYVIQKYKEAK